MSLQITTMFNFMFIEIKKWGFSRGVLKITFPYISINNKVFVSFGSIDTIISILLFYRQYFLVVRCRNDCNFIFLAQAIWHQIVVLMTLDHVKTCEYMYVCKYTCELGCVVFGKNQFEFCNLLELGWVTLVTFSFIDTVVTVKSGCYDTVAWVEWKSKN